MPMSPERDREHYEKVVPAFKKAEDEVDRLSKVRSENITNQIAEQNIVSGDRVLVTFYDRIPGFAKEDKGKSGEEPEYEGYFEARYDNFSKEAGTVIVKFEEIEFKDKSKIISELYGRPGEINALALKNIHKIE